MLYGLLFLVFFLHPCMINFLVLLIFCMINVRMICRKKIKKISTLAGPKGSLISQTTMLISWVFRTMRMIRASMSYPTAYRIVYAYVLFLYWFSFHSLLPFSFFTKQTLVEAIFMGSLHIGFLTSYVCVRTSVCFSAAVLQKNKKKLDYSTTGAADSFK